MERGETGGEEEGGTAERKEDRGETTDRREQKNSRGGIKPPESLLVFLRPFFFAFSFLFSCFVFLKLLQLIGGGAGSLGLFTPVPDTLSQPCPPASIRPG